MAEDKKENTGGFLEDICNSIAIRNAVEASRDKNGKVDKWKALGICTGFGHTSPQEMTTLVEFLSREGAFDDDNSPTSCDDEDDYVPLYSYPTGYIDEKE